MSDRSTNPVSEEKRQFSLVMVVPFSHVAVNAELASTEGLGPCEPLAAVSSSSDEYLSLFYAFLFQGILFEYILLIY